MQQWSSGKFGTEGRSEILFLPFPYPSFPSPSLSFPRLPSSFSLLYPYLLFFLFYLPLEVGPLNPARESREHCKFPQWGLGRNPSWNRIWCISALKYDIWWQQFQWVFWESTYHRLCSLLGGTLLYHCFPLSWYHFGRTAFFLDYTTVVQQVRPAGRSQTTHSQQLLMQWCQWRRFTSTHTHTHTHTHCAIQPSLQSPLQQALSAACCCVLLLLLRIVMRWRHCSNMAAVI